MLNLLFADKVLHRGANKNARAESICEHFLGIVSIQSSHSTYNSPSETFV